MSKKKSNDKESTEVLATDPDPVQIGDGKDEAVDAPATETAATETDPVVLGGDATGTATADKGDSETADKPGAEPEPDAKPDKTASKSKSTSPESTESETKAAKPPSKTGRDSRHKIHPPPPPAKPRRSFFGFFNFLLILALAGAGGYYYWLEMQVKQDYRDTIADLRQQLATKAASSQLESSVAPLRAELGSVGQKLQELDAAQQGLQVTSEKLFELHGRDKNDWQFAEVEYLMRIAQHRLILQDDFEGAAVTLQVASDKIALTGDPGLLPVRVLISEEIADLKTRKRPDLVGMTLILAQLARQVPTLRPGFEVQARPVESAPVAAAGDQDWIDQIVAWIDSLVEVRNVDRQPSQIEATIVDVGETLEDNLKLARWAVLDRDARQYAELIAQSLRLFREFYDLDDAANADFHDQLLKLEKMQLRSEKPDITGSLREMARILSQRKNAPAESDTPDAEPTDG